MHLWGLHIVDLSIVIVFLAAILVVGVWVSRSVKHESDFFLSGRKMGKTLQFFLSFGNATDSTGAVQLSSEVFRQGVGGLWIAFQTLFITPFFWFTQVWFRRSRLVTMADLFVDRFDSKLLASMYAGFNIIIALILLGLGNLTAYKVTASMVVKSPDTYTAAEHQTVQDFEEYQKLKSQKVAGTFPSGMTSRFDELNDLNTRGLLRSSIPYYQPIPFYIAYSTIVAIYISLGGLKAAAITDAIQGLLVLVMSVLLIPLGLHKIGGFTGLHMQVPEYKFQLVGSVAYSEYTWYSIFAITFASLIQIFGLVHNMGIGGSAKDEDTARFGMISGGFMKRFVLIGWAFCGLLAVAVFPTGLSDPDNAWGALSTQLLGPGLMGLMLAGMLLGHMPAVGVSAVSISALATRNLYQPLVQGRTDRHYLRVGQISIAVVLILGILVATVFTGVIQALTMMITFNTFFGAAVFLIFFWRRLTAPSIMMGLAIWVIGIGLIPWAAQYSQDFRRAPQLLQMTPERTTQIKQPADANDVAAGLAKHTGELILKPHVILPKSVYFEGVAAVNALDPNSPKEGLGRFNVETYTLHLLGIPVERFSPAGLLTTRWLFDGLFPFVMLMIFSFMTPRTDPLRVARFHAKMKTPIAPTPEQDHAQVLLSFEDPHRFDDQKLLPWSSWEFTKWTAKDYIGFGGCWVVVGLILVILSIILKLGK